MLEGDRRADGIKRHFHGEDRRRPGRIELSHPLEPLAEKSPAFPGKQRLGPVACSETFRWFLGGWIAHVPEMMVFYAPTINSYKRYQAGSWAPTRMAWSYDNRTAGFRVVGKGTACGSSAGSPAPIAIRTSPSPRRWPPGLTASRTRSIRRRSSREMSTRRSTSPRSAHLPRGDRSLRKERIREERFRRRSGRALPSLLSNGAGSVRQNSNRLGAPTIF